MKAEEILNAKFDELSSGEKIQTIGELVDLAADFRDIRFLDKAFLIAEGLDLDRLQSINRLNFYYFFANAWSTKRLINSQAKPNSWEYIKDELIQELYHLRKCISIKDFENSSQEFQCQVYTNLGNLFYSIGRFVEALEYWNLALKVIPDFHMALGNKARGLFEYARLLYDDSHRNIFIYHAYNSIKEALNDEEIVHPSACRSFKDLLNHIQTKWPKEYLTSRHSFDYNLGKDKKLTTYRRWCLTHTLYLNPLNDLSPYNVACHDILHLPNMTVPVGDPPKYHSLFNQIKQEYGTARFLFYEGLQLSKPNYSDKDIVLVDTLDYAEYSFNLEKVKIAYRLIYSLFDKIAYFLNSYLGVGIENHKSSFRALWHEPKKDSPLRTIFNESRNEALKGLYWLSKDLFSRDEAHNNVIEPEAKELAEIRNFIEHKSFKVTKGYPLKMYDPDDLVYSIDRKSFEEKTLKQMKLVRSAIIYTILAINFEEKNKEFKPTVPLFFPTIEFKNKM
ncbi:hypothetical protein D0X99_19610 [Algoriphagus lacus]|uniref:LA2681-like HEPN domain-containing protein n=1 Tax=Algoriphagus lacus TaxID=2056311 RepID=A0A418PLV4_9BACT|nr:LA2681 family HEPN domain-containing protein [Algoriphagus lacus]RIW12165.1 hypothetical protein D0X99_19610 [Algoriphagus lacus]